MRLVFGHGEPGQGARAFWPGEVPGLRGMLAVGGTIGAEGGGEAGQGQLGGLFGGRIVRQALDDLGQVHFGQVPE